MSDAEIRNAERRWRSTGNLADGEAWVQAVLRSTGAPTLPMISMLIQQARALHALAIGPGNPAHRLSSGIVEAIRQPVTPDDMVSFLRGTGEWARGPVDVPAVTTPVADGVTVRGSRSLQRAATIAEAETREDVEQMARLVGLADAGVLPVSAAQSDMERAQATQDSIVIASNMQRGVPRGSAILCDHANENPGHCPCAPDCYCRQDGNTCWGRRTSSGSIA